MVSMLCGTYLLSEIPSDGDGEFSLERLGTVYNSDLANGLGNLVQRVASMTVKYCNGQFSVGDSVDRFKVDRFLVGCAFDHALDLSLRSYGPSNQKIEESKPWELAKSNWIQLPNY